MNSFVAVTMQKKHSSVPILSIRKKRFEREQNGIGVNHGRQMWPVKKDCETALNALTDSVAAAL